MTIQRDEKFADAIESIVKIFSSPDKQSQIKHQILTRQIDLTKKDILELSALPQNQIKDVLQGRKRFWQARSDANKIRKTKLLKKA